MTNFRVRYGNGRPADVRTWTETHKKRDVVEVNYTEARKITSPNSAYLIKSAVA
jgi:hypothetical protein